MSDRRYFWLKLPTGFFKRHDIKILESMDNGKDYLLFYMKLMLESLDHEGRLRFSEAIPYDYKMLSIVTDTNVDIVKTAMEILERLQLIKIMDDETIYIQAVEKMIGSETAAAERQRRSRENRRALESESVTMSQAVTACHNPSQICHREIEIELEKELDIEEKESISYEIDEKEKAELSLSAPQEPKPKKRFVKPTVEEIRAYCQERKNSVDPEAFFAFYESKGWKVGKAPMKDWKAAVITWEKRGGNRSQNIRGAPGGNPFDRLAREEGYIEAPEDGMKYIGGDF